MSSGGLGVCEVVLEFADAEPHHRAAALFQSLLRIPALAHSNEIFALSVAFGFLNLCGLTAKVSTDAAGDLVEQALTGTVDVRQIAATLKSWTG
ncbi:hypothetical protein [Streptomyces sp. NPDC005407]|uniref:hypothetical protein n=1 Tax=Streptomyces sp. NPDC005407 TaxID=3155340 RepID=UPI0033B2A390